jgi:hypothetical protein
MILFDFGGEAELLRLCILEFLAGQVTSNGESLPVHVCPPYIASHAQENPLSFHASVSHRAELHLNPSTKGKKSICKHILPSHSSLRCLQRKFIPLRRPVRPVKRIKMPNPLPYPPINLPCHGIFLMSEPLSGPDMIFPIPLPTQR